MVSWFCDLVWCFLFCFVILLMLIALLLAFAVFPASSDVVTPSVQVCPCVLDLWFSGPRLFIWTF